MIRNVKIKTVTQEIIVKAFNQLTLEELLRVNRLPVNLFQGYIVSSKRISKPISLNISIKDIDKDNEIILQCIRNTDLRQVLPQNFFYKKTDNPIVALHDINIGGKECTETIHEINESEAKNIIAAKVNEFMKEYSSAKKIIVGISGGGDSNTLVKSLKEFSIKNCPNKEYICFTLVLDPIWPNSGAQRAAELCQKNNVKHFIYNAEDTEKLLGMKESLANFFNEFNKNFGDDAAEFFGTYLVSLMARKLCKKYKTTEYCLGFNREDILSELLFSLMNGHKPLPFPIRTFGDIKLLMPLWEIPKRILDACYPKYSIENYQERIDKTTFQRSIVYYLAHGVEDVYDNLGLSLMKGIKKLFSNEWSKLKHDEVGDLFISEYAEKEEIDKIKTLIKKYFK